MTNIATRVGEMTKTIRQLSLCVGIAAFGLNGLILLMTGSWLPENPPLLKLVCLTWVIAASAMFYVSRKPWLAALGLWPWFTCSTVYVLRVTDHSSISWLLYQDSFQIAAVILIHVAAFMGRFSQTSNT